MSGYPKYKVKVLSLPQIGFPFPGEAEVNVVAEILGENAREAMVDTIVAVILHNRVPAIGEEIEVTEYAGYYGQAAEGSMRRNAEHLRYSYRV